MSTILNSRRELSNARLMWIKLVMVSVVFFSGVVLELKADQSEERRVERGVYRYYDVVTSAIHSGHCKDSTTPHRVMDLDETGLCDSDPKGCAKTFQGQGCVATKSSVCCEHAFRFKGNAASLMYSSPEQLRNFEYDIHGKEHGLFCNGVKKEGFIFRIKDYGTPHMCRLDTVRCSEVLNRMGHQCKIDGQHVCCTDPVYLHESVYYDSSNGVAHKYFSSGGGMTVDSFSIPLLTLFFLLTVG